MRSGKKLYYFLFCMGFGFHWLGGCVGQPGTDTGNPSSVGIKFVGTRDTSLQKLSALASSPGADITEARIVLKNLDMDPLSTCLTVGQETPGPDEFNFELLGPFVINLLDNTSIPALDVFQISSGPYCEIDLTFDPIESQDLPKEISPEDPIVGNALLVRGARQDGTNFVVRLKHDDRFRLEASSPTGFEIADSNGVARFFVSFDLTTWLTGVDLDSATVSADGTIHIDDANNNALLTPIVQNVIHSARLFRDLNGNGILEPEEELPSLVLGEGADEKD